MEESNSNIDAKTLTEVLGLGESAQTITAGDLREYVGSILTQIGDNDKEMLSLLAAVNDLPGSKQEKLETLAKALIREKMGQ